MDEKANGQLEKIKGQLNANARPDAENASANAEADGEDSPETFSINKIRALTEADVFDLLKSKEGIVQLRTMIRTLNKPVVEAYTKKGFKNEKEFAQNGAQKGWLAFEALLEGCRSFLDTAKKAKHIDDTVIAAWSAHLITLRDKLLEMPEAIAGGTEKLDKKEKKDAPSHSDMDLNEVVSKRKEIESITKEVSKDALTEIEAYESLMKALSVLEDAKKEAPDGMVGFGRLEYTKEEIEDAEKLVHEHFEQVKAALHEKRKEFVDAFGGEEVVEVLNATMPKEVPKSVPQRDESEGTPPAAENESPHHNAMSIEAFSEMITSGYAVINQIDTIDQRFKELEGQREAGEITDEEWNTINEAYQSLKSFLEQKRTSSIKDHPAVIHQHYEEYLKLFEAPAGRSAPPGGEQNGPAPQPDTPGNIDSPKEGEWREAKQEWRRVREQYEEALRKHYEALQNQNVFVRGGRSLRELLGGKKAALPEEVQALENRYRDARRAYAEKLSEASRQRKASREDVSKALDSDNENIKAAAANRLVLDAIRARQRIQSEVLVPSETRRKINEWMKNNRWGRFAGMAAIAGGVGLMTGGIGAAFALAGRKIAGMTAGAYAGAAASAFVYSLFEISVMGRETAVEERERSVRSGFDATQSITEESDRELAKEYDTLELRKKQQQAAAVAAGAATAIGVGASVTDATDIELPGAGAEGGAYIPPEAPVLEPEPLREGTPSAYTGDSPASPVPPPDFEPPAPPEPHSVGDVQEVPPAPLESEEPVGDIPPPDRTADFGYPEAPGSIPDDDRTSNFGYPEAPNNIPPLDRTADYGYPESPGGIPDDDRTSNFGYPETPEDTVSEAPMTQAVESESTLYTVEKGDNLWNILEGKGPDANPVGGQSEVLKGLSLTERNAALDALVDRMEQDAEFTKSVGIESGDPHRLAVHDTIAIGPLEAELEKIVAEQSAASVTPDVSPIPEAPAADAATDTTPEATEAHTEPATQEKTPAIVEAEKESFIKEHLGERPKGILGFLTGGENAYDILSDKTMHEIADMSVQDFNQAGISGEQLNNFSNMIEEMRDTVEPEAFEGSTQTLEEYMRSFILAKDVGEAPSGLGTEGRLVPEHDPMWRDDVKNK